MKSFITTLLAGVIGAVAAGVIMYTFLSTSKASALKEQKEKYESQIKKQKFVSDDQRAEQAGRLDKTTRSAVVSGSKKDQEIATLKNTLTERNKAIEELKARLPTPEAIIEALKTLNPNRGRQREITRKVIHYFIALETHGVSALPPIQKFLKEGVDINYNRGTGRDNGSGLGRLSGNDDRDKVDWSSARDYGYKLPAFGIALEPRSLRLGLFEITYNIGGKDAEKILAAALTTTGLGIEVVRLGDLLEQLAPGKYKKAMLDAARELITNPLDEDSKRILFALLLKYKDPGLLDLAKGMLISSEGRIDGAALRYLNETLGENAMPLLLAAYRNPNITNPADKIILRDAAMTYVGKNSDADQIFREVFDEGLRKAKDSEANPREAWLSLIQAGGALQKGDNLTENVIRNRQKLLNEYRGNTKNELVERGLDQVNKNLEGRMERLKPKN
jgi:hypothetical protein